MGWFSKKPSEFDTMMQVLKSVPLDKWVLGGTKDTPEIRFGELLIRGQLQSVPAWDWNDNSRSLYFLADIYNKGTETVADNYQRHTVGKWLADVGRRLVSLQVLNQLKEDNNGVV